MPNGDAHLQRWRIVEHVLLAAFAIYLLYFLTGFRFEALVTGDTRQADFRMWYLLPPQIAAQDYPSVVTGNWDISFPYLPSAVAMMLPLSLMPQVAAFIVWMILQGLAFVTVIWASLRLAGLERSHLRLPIAAAAVFVVGSAIEWDLRAHNNNLIYLALVMLGLTTRRTWVAAALLAVTANLKLYSGILIPGLLWRREVRLAVATGLIAVALAVALPCLPSARRRRSSCPAAGSTKSSTPCRTPAGHTLRCRCTRPPRPCLAWRPPLRHRRWPRVAHSLSGWRWWRSTSLVPRGAPAQAALRGSATSSCC